MEVLATTPGNTGLIAGQPGDPTSQRPLTNQTHYTNEELMALGAEVEQARAALADPTRSHDARVVHAVTSAGAELHRATLQAVPVAKLQPGMILAEDLRAMGGAAAFAPAAARGAGTSPTNSTSSSAATAAADGRGVSHSARALEWEKITGAFVTRSASSIVASLTWLRRQSF